MSLDLGLADGPHARHPGSSVSFDNDAYYWFCFPFFEKLHERTGEIIDLYDGASFGGDQLACFASTVADLRVAASALPEVSEVCIGHRISRDAPPEPVLAWLNRANLLRLLDGLDALVAEAQREEKWIVCVGD